MIKVLHVVPSLGSGGIESLLYNYYVNMDKSIIKFDFIVHGNEIGIFEKKFLELGSEVFHIPSRKDSFIRNYREMKKIIKENKYDVVHSHLEHMSFIPMYLSKKYKVNKRITHTHLSYQENLIRRIINKPLKYIAKKKANIYYGCSSDALMNFFGKKFKYGEVLSNAIDKDKFTYSSKYRKEIRKKLLINDEILIGNIGRFTNQKNHLFLIDIFYEITKINNNTKLVLIGEGPLEKEIKNKINYYRLDENIIFIKPTMDINKYMSAFDIFLFPSIYEGLGIVLIESQAATLKTFASDKVIPKETDISKHIEYIDLSLGAKEWARIVMSADYYERNNANDFIDETGFNIQTEVKFLLKKYGAHDD